MRHLFSFSLFCVLHSVDAFIAVNNGNRLNEIKHQTVNQVSTELRSSSQEPWKGEVVPGQTIQGCSVRLVEGTLTEWEITIDGIDADLGRFSEAIYKKITQDAKQQRFQGFRPGTIPPHLLPTYIAFTMDECARETVLEAMTQNNIRPFENARTDFEFETISIPPPEKKGGKKKKKKKVVSDSADQGMDLVEEKPQWKTFDTMKEAIDAGWKPGQSFSFVAKKCKGQRVKNDSETAGASPLGLNY